MIPLEALGWFCLGAGSATLVILGPPIIAMIVRHMRNKNKFGAYVESLKGFSEALAKMNEERSKEVSELSFRDKDGKLCTVKIVVDYRLDDRLTDEDKEKMRQMLASGEGGKLHDIMTGHNVTEGEMDRIQQFVFSGYTAEQMRARGLELDEVVRKMLKASGRIA